MKMDSRNCNTVHDAPSGALPVFSFLGPFSAAFGQFIILIQQLRKIIICCDDFVFLVMFHIQCSVMHYIFHFQVSFVFMHRKTRLKLYSMRKATGFASLDSWKDTQIFDCLICSFPDVFWKNEMQITSGCSMSSCIYFTYTRMVLLRVVS